MISYAQLLKSASQAKRAEMSPDTQARIAYAVLGGAAGGLGGHLLGNLVQGKRRSWQNRLAWALAGAGAGGAAGWFLNPNQLAAMSDKGGTDGEGKAPDPNGKGTEGDRKPKKPSMFKLHPMEHPVGAGIGGAAGAVAGGGGGAVLGDKLDDFWKLWKLQHSSWGPAQVYADPLWKRVMNAVRAKDIKQLTPAKKTVLQFNRNSGLSGTKMNRDAYEKYLRELIANGVDADEQFQARLKLEALTKAPKGHLFRNTLGGAGMIGGGYLGAAAGGAIANAINPVDLGAQAAQAF